MQADGRAMRVAMLCASSLIFAVIVATVLAGVAGLTLLGWEVAADTVALVLLGVVLVLGVVFFASLRSRAR